MELNNNDAAVRTDSADAQTGTVSAGEIDLYDELSAFAELPPEEQLRLLDRPESLSAEPESLSAETEQESAFPEPVLTHAPNESVESATAAAEIETPFAEETQEPPPHAQALTQLSSEPSEPVETETEAAEMATSSTEDAEVHNWREQVLPEAETAEAAETETSTEAPELLTSPVPGSESASGSELLHGYVESGKDTPEPSEGSRPSGPLSGFNLTPDFVFTGALSRGVCLACGAESGADDLFCMTCGVFIDEIASILPSNPTCGECQQGIAAGEIFCPWCGSSLPA